jgi:hypothetical protein
MMKQVVCLLLISLAPAHLEAEAERTLASFFPSACGIWHPADTLRIFAGKKLYDLIDGGADVYLEYGFVRAGARHYSVAAGGEISLEIHEMRDTLAAWGIFSFLTAGTGSPAAFGQEGVEGDDFVIFWKSRFLVLVTALNENGRSGLSSLADAASEHIRPAGRKPELARTLLLPEFQNSEVVLVKGAVAFERRAEIGLGNIFHVREGVSGVWNDCRTFVLRYPNKRESRSAELAGIRLLKGRGGFTQHSGGDVPGFLSGPRGKLIHVARDRRYLLLTVGENAEKVRSTAAALAKAASAHLIP